MLCSSRASPAACRRCWLAPGQKVSHRMAIRQSRNQIVPVDSVSPNEGPQGFGYFAAVYHHLFTSSWPFLMVQVGAVFFGLNGLFALAYYFDGGVANARTFTDTFFFSVETMATIGYGRMAPITLLAHILMSLEALAG